MTRANVSSEAIVFDLSLAVDDADVLCSLLSETIHLAQSENCHDEHTDLLAAIRDKILRGLAAKGNAESVCLEFQPVEAVCLLLLLNEMLSDCPDADESDKLDIDALLGLSPQTLTVAPAI